jgi:hypothetical protein
MKGVTRMRRLPWTAFHHPYAYAQSHEHDGDRVVQTAAAE